MRPSYRVLDVYYFRALPKYTDTIFDYAAKRLGWGWEDLVTASRLSRATVFRLGRRETKWPRFATLWKLARAVGLELQVCDADGNLVRLPRAKKATAKKAPAKKKPKSKKTAA